MGINIILPLIMGIAMTVIIGSQVAPNYIEKIKIAKVENRTISNQNLIKEAIVRYIKMEGKIPTKLDNLKTLLLMENQHNDNLFNGNYTYELVKLPDGRYNGVLKIFTTINDEGAGKYFSNSFKFPNPPKCVGGLVDGLCESKEWETFYLLDKDIFEALPKVGSLEWINEEYSKENLVKKVNPPEVGDKVYIIPDGKENTVEVYDCIDVDCATNPDSLTMVEEKIVGGIGSETGVFISNLEIPYHTWDEINKELVPATYQHEKVHCKDTTLSDKEVFVINENTKLPEFVWVASDSVSAIQNKIFEDNYTPNNICTSNVTSMYEMFDSKTTFDEPLDKWDTSKVTNMIAMFSNAESFNQELNFNTSNVISMQSMFSGASSFNNFNKPLNFDTSNVATMEKMFFLANSFNKPLKFDTRNVEDMDFMFWVAKEFNQPLNFDTSKVTTMSGMFYFASSFNNGCEMGILECPLNFDTSNVTDMYFMFKSAKSFNQPLKFVTSNVIYMQSMFDYAIKFNQPLNFDTSKVTTMSGMFYVASSFNNGCLENDFSCPLNFDTSKVTSMEGMFYKASSFNQKIEFSDTLNVENMSSMFYGAQSFNQPLNFDTPNVTNMNAMFREATIFNQDLSEWCVKIYGKPAFFDLGATSWNKTDRQPKWNCHKTP